MLTLALMGFLLGIAILALFRLTTDQAALRAARRRRQAHLYELRLFTDEPALIWHAQVGLIAANARYLRAILLPALIVSVPVIVLFPYLEGYFAHAPLPVGQPAILTVHMNAPLEATLQTPAGFDADAPAVRVPGEHQLSWRIRPARDIAGTLRVILPGQSFEKTVVAGTGWHYLSDRRVRSLLDHLWHPAEPRLPAGPIDWIEIRYPPAALGIPISWTVWLLLFSALGAAAISPFLKQLPARHSGAAPRAEQAQD